MPRDNFPQKDTKPFAGLTARRIAKGLPVGPIPPRPLEWWQAAEEADVATIERMRAEGKV